MSSKNAEPGHGSPESNIDMSDSSSESNWPGDHEYGLDGGVERIWKRTTKPVAAIFVHAGAGYHSVTNEKVHLEACSEASRVAMRFLKAGASAPEAVEAAIRCLEDKEITNAGFGSNLNMDGVVECDATVVDHLGRSGACGAVPGIKNPISLAKLILDKSSQPLSLRRVPPNILVGLGARDFAEEHGMATVPNEYLISKNAKDRFLRWKEDLKKAEARHITQSSNSSHISQVSLRNLETHRPSPTPSDYEKAAETLNASTLLRDHSSAILTGIWNEGQPDSPYGRGSPLLGENGSLGSAPSATPRPPQRSLTNGSKPVDRAAMNYVSGAFQSRATTGSPAATKRAVVRHSHSEDIGYFPATGETLRRSPSLSTHDGFVSAKEDHNQSLNTMENQLEEQLLLPAQINDPVFANAPKQKEDEDLITDTVGAIAVDLKGRIAAGSSSGGIGIKHRGRIGPAALVGIGTAVIPEDSDDHTGTSVAAVTSGTGEHMATSIASAKCAERLFESSRRGFGGHSISELDEHALLEAFILDDFMGHPGVKNQPSAGAIGVMTVKKDRTGYYFYFAHNTDSFALASMASTEREPSVVMSRLGEIGPVAQGGRRIRID
ncbi:putative 20S proteasome subunit alpha type 2 [Neurospora hispaniola]|uniref:20S proteasome subunit alpha type 2 n=1 Tax=Neurospora hispaniola TaxID=588809 RepID=A0AAJ0I5R5_9PEZI|nr:putative 20S proteasome subunit alpha type 2 [Neurospora hispaniola]